MIQKANRLRAFFANPGFSPYDFSTAEAGVFLKTVTARPAERDRA